jgi:hypothetical protein
MQPVEIAGDDERRLQSVCLTGAVNDFVGFQFELDRRDKSRRSTELNPNAGQMPAFGVALTLHNHH